ncbi:hypothetical protein [Pseudomonas putida]|uniref:hypothetical protein n=1 Tax=Pseudomonas putida TaxID=303 RepID=UPI000AF7A102|nr:hypothetical protein [Pseudomonas putida]
MPRLTSEINSEDIELMLSRARALCLPPDFPSVVEADWLLEGTLGSRCWITKNSGKEFYDQGWRNTKNVYFDHVLADGSRFNDIANIKSFESFQKWAFAYRSGWLGESPSPKAWCQGVGWGLGLVSWMFLKKDELLPCEYGFKLLGKTDVLMLLEELATGNWAYALRLMPRSFDELYRLTYDCTPDEGLVQLLPYVPPSVASDIHDALHQRKLFVRNNPSDQQVVSRRFLSELLGCSIGFFNEVNIRQFLRTFECLSKDKKILLPGYYSTPLPSSKALPVTPKSVGRPSQQSLNKHAINCVHFLEGSKIPSIGMPIIALEYKEMIKDLSAAASGVKHQYLIPLTDGIAAINEAALWVTRFGDDILRIHEGHLKERLEIVKAYPEYGASFVWKRNSEAYDKRWKREQLCETYVKSEFGVVKNLGLSRATSLDKRSIQKGDLTLSQALFVLVGACAYVLAMMKPMREGELEDIPLRCVLVHNQDGGCWLKVPVEKSAALGVKTEAERPIPYLAFKAITILQKLANVTKLYFGGNEIRERLFYFPGMDGFSPPVQISVKNTVARCMDYFCEYLNLPVDEFGRRHYFRIHELRKFFLMTLVLAEPQDGWEAGAWMAAHKDPDHMQAYTEANIDAAEISNWEAEYFEEKLLSLESQSNAAINKSDVIKLYESIKRDLNVEKLSALPGDKLRQYVKSAITSGRFVVESYSLPGFEVGVGVIIKG